MRKSWLVCVWLVALAWGQAAPEAPRPPAPSNQAPAQNNQAPSGSMNRPPAPPDMSASVPANAAVITITGVCPPSSGIGSVKAGAARTGASASGTTKTSTAKTSAASTKDPADCKTIITKADFETLAKGVAPNMTPQLRRQLASMLPRLIAMSQDARKKGLDKTEQYKEMLKFAQMQILTNALNHQIQEDAANVPPDEITSYYKDHAENFEQFNVDRLFIPRFKQASAEAEDKDRDKDKDKEQKDGKSAEEQQKTKEAEEKSTQEQGEQDLAKLADSLRARAAAGEDFAKLQKEAFDAAGMKIDSPTINLPKVRRTGLPPDHAKAGIFDLKPGEVSQVITDNGGHYIYKVNSKEQLPLDQVKDEIHSTLQNQRQREMMDKVQSSFKTETNETYFGPPGANGGHPPPPRIPNPHMVPAPTTPSPQPNAPPPASKPN